MLKTFKKSIALFVALVFVMSLMPFGVMAEVSTNKVAVLNYQAWAMSRNGSGANTTYALYKYDNSTFGVNLNSSSDTNDRRAYAQVDFSGYEEILENQSTVVTFGFKTSTGSTYALKNFNVYAINDSADVYSTMYVTDDDPVYNGDMSIRMSLNQATALGLNNYTGNGVLLVSRSDGNAGYYRTVVNKDDLVSILKTGTDNSLVSLAFKATKGAQYIFTSPNYAVKDGTSVSISYEPSEIDNQAYVNSVAEEFSWADITEQSIDQVTDDLVLPASYRGVDITWASSNPEFITSDGAVTQAKKANTVTLTATFNYKGAEESATIGTTTKDFVVTVSSFPSKVVIVPFSNYGHARDDKTTSQGFTTNPDYKSVNYVSTGGIWEAYAQFDLSAYEEILRNPNTTAKFKIMAGNGYTKSYAYDFRVFLASDSVDSYKYDKIYWKQAKDMGMFNRERPVIYERTDSTQAGNGTVFEGDVNLSDLLDVLDESETNGVVTMWIDAISSSSSFRINDKQTGLIITYYEDEIDYAEHFNGIKSNFKWEKLTSDSKDELINDLPTYFRGANITWSADVDGVVLADGKVIQAIGVDNTLKLTANVEYKGYSFTETFDVKVPQEELKSVVVPLHSSTFISGSSPSKPQGGYDSAETGRSFYYRYMYPADFYSDGNDRVTFLKWDFTNYLNELNAARSMSISINASDVQDGGVTLFSVLADGYEDWTETNLTYDKAVESGMYTDPALASQRLSGIKKQMEITSSAEMLNGIKKSIADNPDDGVVNFRWEALGQAVTSYRLPNNVKTNFTVTLYYYESELSEVAKTKVSEMPWSFVSAQPIDSVVANLTLPATFYGAPVTWASSDETVITSSGEVIVGEADKQVTLTATVNDLTKDFVVTVPANVDFVVKAENNNYSNVFVWAKEANAYETLVVAKYYDGELISVDVREDIALNKGENFIWTKIRSDEAGVVIKVMLLDDMGSLKPLMPVK